MRRRVDREGHGHRGRARLRRVNLLKIQKIETYLVGNPWKTWLFVRVITDDGIHGVGEGTLGQLNRAVEGALHDMEPLIQGMSPFDIEALVLRLNRDIYADGGQIKMAAIS